MKTQQGVTRSELLLWMMLLLVGFALGIHVGSQFFADRPDFVTSILLGITLLGCVILPAVRKREKAKEATTQGA